MDEKQPAPEPLNKVLFSAIGWLLLALAFVLSVRLAGLILVASNLIAWVPAFAVTGPVASLGAALLLLYAAGPGLIAQTFAGKRPLPRSALGLLALACAAGGTISALVRAGTGGVAPELSLPAVGSGLAWAVSGTAPWALAIPLAITSVVTAVWVTPVAEEHFFRGWLWRRLGAHSPHLKGFTTGGLWVLTHHFGPTLLVILPFAVLLTWLRFRTGTPRAGVAMNAAYHGGVLVGAVLSGVLSGRG